MERELPTHVTVNSRVGFIGNVAVMWTGSAADGLVARAVIFS
jgi:hypothetical protein